MNHSEMLQQIGTGNRKALARGISVIENRLPGYREMLSSLADNPKRIIGITGPPGAGKSTLVDALIRSMVKRGKSAGVLCVDPSSIFNRGALLGDRIRMSEWYTNEKVFIRSLSSRGALGGLHPMIIEIAELMKVAPFDYVIIETVGVGQSEVEIAGLADTTVVVMVPEGGDEVQTMKTGLMEIADIFVVNKSDRPGADLFTRNLRTMLSPVFHHERKPVPVIQTMATEGKGIEDLIHLIEKHETSSGWQERRTFTLAEKAYHLIREKRMVDVDKRTLHDLITEKLRNGDFNLYQFIERY
jgi:LAO/AO transport system kinase